MNRTALLSSLSKANFDAQRRSTYVRTDSMFGWVMAIQYVLGVVFAIWLSPKTYSGGLWSVHPHVWMALGLGAVLAAYPIVLTTRRPGETTTRFAVAISQALFSALLIHLTNGRIETHFHVFGSLAFLAMYRDWRVLAINSTIVAVDHVLRGALFPGSIYGVGLGAEWRFIEHAGWVLFEDTFLLVGIASNIREMKGLAERQAEVQVAHDELKASAAEIDRQAIILDSVLSGMSDSVVMVAPDGRFMHMNSAAQQMLGPDAMDVPPERWSERFGMVDDQGQPLAVEALPLVRALRGDSIREEHLRVALPDDGGTMWLEVGAEPLKSEEGESIGAVAVFRDITGRHRMMEEMAFARREAERANLAKSEFLSRMSHELRTPMNAILGFGQILRMDELTEDQDESLDQILRAGAHLLKLINEILDLSGIESGKLTISKEPVDAVEVAHEVIGMVRPLSAAANITVHAPEVAADSAYALADRQRLLQSLLNLVSNGIKYNVPGGELWIEIEREDDRLRVAVQDSGPGIPEEKRSRLFSPFERLDAETTSVEGTGLGLALTKRIVEAMGGQISLAPSEFGCRFVLDFPGASCPMKVLEEISLDKPISSGPDSTAILDVLLIEDNPANVRLVERVMEYRSNVRLWTAADALSGIEMAREHRPGLILLDLDLPDLPGQEVLRLIRSDKRVGSPRVVVVSADADPTHSLRLAELGAMAYLTKPFEIEDLLALTDELIKEERKAA